MNNRITRIYLDTSVFGGFFDPDFEEDSQILFEKIKMRQFVVIYSNITEEELLGAPDRVQKLLSDLPERYKIRIELTEEAINLADQYLAENVVGRTSRSDCFHIAIATIHEVDLLISWNFKHIVNIKRIRGYNAVSMKFGYKTIDIRSPKEIIYNEN